MANPVAVPLAAAVAAGAPVRVKAKGPTTMYFELGTGSMTIQFQYSANGIDWSNAGAVLAASGFRTVTDELAWVRADTTVFVSIGTATAKVLA
jgi:hypothetical protein